MKWPWASRARLEDCERRLIAIECDLAAERASRIGWERSSEHWMREAQAARIERHANNGRYDDLLEKFTVLRVAGAVPEIKPTEEQIRKIELQQPDELRDLIHERFGHDSRRLKMALSQLRADRAANVDDDTIRESILNGWSPEGVPA